MINFMLAETLLQGDAPRRNFGRLNQLNLPFAAVHFSAQALPWLLAPGTDEPIDRYTLI